MIELEEELRGFYNYFLESLQAIADEAQQEQSWKGGDYSTYSDFDEIYIHFIDSCENILTWNSLPSSKKSLLEMLYIMVEDFNEDYNQKKMIEKDICDDPKWHKIRFLAKQLYNDLKHVKYVS